MYLTIKNILANIIGQAWVILSAFLFIPLYIRHLGFGSYTIISFTILIAGIVVVLDSGLTATLSREFARKDKNDEEKKQTYQTLETLFITIIFIAITLMILFSDNIAANVDSLVYPKKQISYFLKIVSVDIGLQLLFRFYQGGMLGLKKQVKANVYSVVWGVFRNAMVIGIIYYFPRLDYFFVWQTIATILFTVIIKYSLDRAVYKRNKFNVKLSFKKDVFRKVSNFVGGMLLISIISVFNTQLDKFVVNKILSVKNLGFYTLAVSISSALILIVNPIATVVLPRFTGYYSNNNQIEAKSLFYKTSKVVSVLIFSFLSVFIFFSKEILWVWTGNEEIVENTFKVIPILSAAYAMVALQIIPYYVALANGYTKLNNFIGIANIVIIIPGYYWGASEYGMLGVAFVFFMVQLLVTIIYLSIVNKKFINGDILNTIFFKQFFSPLILSLIIVFCVRCLYVESTNRWFVFIWIFLALFLALLVNVVINFTKDFIKLLFVFKQKVLNKNK
ncbi:hypothetical protein D1Y73_05460 [Riemerella anatipestifer]|uniref:lipopolysaccharide biosynthesis protein n=1 Tax=Riemerella anatipestifer TaxID=34085 RepID=UPI0012B43114|nr:oligosaccharide flippase family protein [Riemerella anatipestifer]MSN82494.1 hypothetical protein [Riemerella anatipestifer]